jgi:hypothetical protein
MIRQYNLAWVYWAFLALFFLWAFGLIPTWMMAAPALMCCMPPALLFIMLLIPLYWLRKPKKADEDIIDAEYEIIEE